MNVPDDIRVSLKKRLWKIADDIDWLALGPVEKTQYYENWARDPEIGGVVSHFLDVRQIRLYIKDTLLRRYPQARLGDTRKPYRLLSICESTESSQSFTRPHGRLLTDGRVISWGRADNWKLVLMATHERAFQAKKGIPFGVLLMQASARYGTAESRAVVTDAASKLGIQAVAWDG